MNILLFGKNGQLGWELQRSLAPLGELVALDRQGAPGLCGDLGEPDGLAATVRALRPDVILNAAAYTAVDRAESEPDLARRINAHAPAALAREAAACGALLVHYSTDYVFHGHGQRPWAEEGPARPRARRARMRKGRGERMGNLHHGTGRPGCDVSPGWVLGPGPGMPVAVTFGTSGPPGLCPRRLPWEPAGVMVLLLPSLHLGRRKVRRAEHEARSACVPAAEG